MTCDEFLGILRSGDLWIFGAGYVSETFWYALCRHGLADRVRGFLVSGQPAADRLHGRPVRSVSETEIGPDNTVCLAVHEAVTGEILPLFAGKTDRVFCAYPYLTELCYGTPALAEEWDIHRLLERQDRSDYWLTVRYAAARARLHMPETKPMAEDLYIRAMAIHSSLSTARRRLEAFGRLTDGMAAEGWRDDRPVFVTSDGRIIDGLHRVACAACLGIRRVPVKVFPDPTAYDVLLGDKNRLPERVLTENGFSPGEMDYLNGAKNELFGSEQSLNLSAPEISVILPVYNIGEYLDVCMESLVGQTFSDMELLLINDGSTDDSASRCRAWAEKDPRVRFIDKENEGVAATRNLGVRLARGKYLAFVDPDDWLDPTYMEKLRDRLETTGADFAECDLWRYDNRSGKKIYRCCGSRMGKPYTLREHMKYGPTATYKSMSRRSLWEKWDLHMPSCSFESPAIYSLIVALSGGVENVPEALYYYRRFRENSLIEIGYAGKDGTPNNTLGVEAMEFLLGEFRRCGIYETYRDTLEGVVKYRLNDILAMQFHRKRPENFRELVGNYRRFMSEVFPEGHNEPYITWGGYNLNRVLTHMDWLHDPSCRFNFSSIVSVCGPEGAALSAVTHKNRYRQIMLERERTRLFWRKLEETRPAYLFMDLMEERFDLIFTGERYLTKSDAYDGRTDAEAEGAVLDRFSPECTRVWKQSAGEFVRRVRETVPGIRLVLVESLLSETVGDLEHREEYSELAEIRRTNALLTEYYAYLESLWPEATVLRPTKDPFYFTDRRYEYGAIPSHINEIFNQSLAEEIQLRLSDGKEETDNG